MSTMIPKHKNGWLFAWKFITKKQIIVGHFFQGFFQIFGERLKAEFV